MLPFLMELVLDLTNLTGGYGRVMGWRECSSGGSGEVKRQSPFFSLLQTHITVISLADMGFGVWGLTKVKGLRGKVVEGDGESVED